MNLEAEFNTFVRGESRLWFIVGRSGPVVKKIDDYSVSVLCWASEALASNFIAEKLSLTTAASFSVQNLNFEEYLELRQSVKWIEDKENVKLELFGIAPRST